MLTKQAFLLHYRALKEYAELRSLSEELHPDPLSQHKAEYIWNFLQPYVCVVHKDGRGYYLNRSYNHIISVLDIPVPTGNDPDIPVELQRVVTHEVTLDHQAASFMTPDWAKQIPSRQFNTYWLY